MKVRAGALRSRWPHRQSFITAVTAGHPAEASTGKGEGGEEEEGEGGEEEAGFPRLQPRNLLQLAFFSVGLRLLPPSPDLITSASVTCLLGSAPFP